MRDTHILPTEEDTARAAAELVSALATKAAETKGRFTVALSGGSTPRLLYSQLSSPRFASYIAWDKWHVFWSDERCVPPDHAESNYRLAKEHLLDRVPILPDQVYRLRGELDPSEAAQEYERQFRGVFGEAKPVFDLVLLGIGEDGHTASLFPGTEALHKERRLVVANWVPQFAAWRLTFTLPLINAAAVIVFLVTQESKAAVVRRVLQSPGDGVLLPAARVRSFSGTVHWFLTDAAAKLLGT